MGKEIETPPANAMSHSPFKILLYAVWIATSDVEQAVNTLKVVPFRFNLYAIRVVIKSLSYNRTLVSCIDGGSGSWGEGEDMEFQAIWGVAPA
jgi:hypothetical protein